MTGTDNHVLCTDENWSHLFLSESLEPVSVWSLNHDCADLNCSNTDYASARTVLLERIWLERIWQCKPIICWSNGLQGDLTGSCSNIAYTLIWCETLFQSTCGMSLQPFFPPPICSHLYLQKRSPCTLTFREVGAIRGLVVDSHLAQCLLWLSTSDLEGKKSSCSSRSVSLWSCAFFFPPNFFFSVYLSWRQLEAGICSYSVFTQLLTQWTGPSFGPQSISEQRKVLTWQQKNLEGSVGREAPWEARHLPMWVRRMTSSPLRGSEWGQCLLV